MQLNAAAYGRECARLKVVLTGSSVNQLTANGIRESSLFLACVLLVIRYAHRVLRILVPFRFGCRLGLGTVWVWVPFGFGCRLGCIKDWSGDRCFGRAIAQQPETAITVRMYTAVSLVQW